MSTDEPDGFDTMAPGDEELFAVLRRSVAGATLPAGAAEVVALGRRTRTRHRAAAAGIGTGAAALVAAIGMLASSTGTGAGGSATAAPPPLGTPSTSMPSTSAPTTGTPAPATSGGAQTLDIQETGFSVQEFADGTVRMTIMQLMDPAALQSALGQAGVPAVIMIEQVPVGWDLDRGIMCRPDAGVTDAGTVGAKVVKLARLGGQDVTIVKSAMPAGSYLTLIQFRYRGQEETTTFGLKIGRQTDCVPEYVVAR